MLSTYLVLRAIYTPMLHDEIATFFYFIQTNDFLPPNAHWDANNHVLNSFLGNISFQVFGDAPWALRLPNVIMFPVYLFFSWKIVARINTTLVRWGVFLALVSTTYTFEYFALCRGYGMSLGFLMCGLYFFLKAWESKKTAWYFWSILMLFLAVSANLTLIYVFLMLVVFSLLGLLLDPAKTLRRKLLLAIIFSVLAISLAAPLIYFSFELKARGALYYGGNNFLEFTLMPLLDLVLGSKSVFLAMAVIAVFVLLLISTLLFFIKNKIRAALEKSLFGLLLIGSIAAIFLNHLVLGVNYPEDRTAMYLIPLFFLSIGFALNHLKTNYLKWIALALFFIPLKFLQEIKVNKALFAIEERHIQEYFNFINQSSENQIFKPTIGGYATQSFCWYYMNYRNGGQQNAMLYSTHPDTICDYQIINQGVTLNKQFQQSYTKLNSAPINKHDLYKRQTTLSKTIITQKDSITNWNHSKTEFFNLIELNIDSTWESKALLIEITGIVHAPNQPFYATFSASQKDNDWSEITQERLFLNWMRYDWSDDKKTFATRFILPNIDSNTAHVQVFLWNIKQKPYLLKNCSITVWLLN